MPNLFRVNLDTGIFIFLNCNSFVTKVLYDKNETSNRLQKVQRGRGFS